MEPLSYHQRFPVLYQKAVKIGYTATAKQFDDWYYEVTKYNRGDPNTILDLIEKLRILGLPIRPGPVTSVKGLTLMLRQRQGVTEIPSSTDEKSLYAAAQKRLGSREGRPEIKYLDDKPMVNYSGRTLTPPQKGTIKVNLSVITSS